MTTDRDVRFIASGAGGRSCEHILGENSDGGRYCIKCGLPINDKSLLFSMVLAIVFIAILLLFAGWLSASTQKWEAVSRYDTFKGWLEHTTIMRLYLTNGNTVDYGKQQIENILKELEAKEKCKK